MTEDRAYSYTILRYVHDVVSGEALNVGVVMHAPATGFLRVRTRKTSGRLRHVFPDLDRRAFVDAMRAVDRGIASIASQANGEPLFDLQTNALRLARKVLPDDDSSLRWSPVGAGLTADPDTTLDRLYERFVARFDRRADRRRRTDEDIWRPVREMLAERDLQIPFESKIVSGTQDRIEFKKAWKNGSWHAYEAVSFDLADADHIKDKARRWRGHLSAVGEGSGEEVDVHFVLGLPRDRGLMPAYKTARQILAGAPFATEVVDESDVDDLVATLEREYRARRR